jgi:hypothetical protein
MTAEEIIEVLNAWIGKLPLQMRSRGGVDRWTDFRDLYNCPCNFVDYEWRVKPELKEIWEIKCKSGQRIETYSRHMASKLAHDNQPCTITRYVETPIDAQP